MVVELDAEENMSFGNTTKVPVVLIVFNRPDTTYEVFQIIRKYAPERLFVIADGPRASRPGERIACHRARTVTERIDWNCEVLRMYRDENLGCRRSVSEGLTWVFEHTERAIILEDDCLPDLTFFRFCVELLERYSDETRIGMIGGVNFQFGQYPMSESYYFSRHCHIWGWATWRRAWRQFDVKMNDWPELRRTDWLRRHVGSGTAAWYWRAVFDDCASRKPDSLSSWAVPWTYSCWRNGMLAILPSMNLVSNIGFGKQSTHTVKHNRFADMTVESMHFPLRHPTIMRTSEAADQYTERTHFYGQDALQRFVWTLRFPFPLHRMRYVQRLMRRLSVLPSALVKPFVRWTE